MHPIPPAREQVRRGAVRSERVSFPRLLPFQDRALALAGAREAASRTQPARATAWQRMLFRRHPQLVPAPASRDQAELALAWAVLAMPVRSWRLQRVRVEPATIPESCSRLSLARAWASPATAAKVRSPCRPQEETSRASAVPAAAQALATATARAAAFPEKTQAQVKLARAMALT